MCQKFTIKTLVFTYCFILLGCASTLEQSAICSGYKNQAEKDQKPNQKRLKKCKSLLVSQKHTYNSPEIGLVYSLPRQHLTFTFERKSLTIDSLTKDLKKEEDKQKLLDTKVKTLDKDITNLNTRLSLIKEAHKPKVEYDLEIKKIDKIIEQRLLNQSKGRSEEIKKSIAELIQSGTNKSTVDGFSIEPSEIVADSNMMFVAKMNKKPWSSDQFEINTTENGLLSGGTAKSEGQVDEIFVALASAIGAFRGSQSPGIQKFAPEAIDVDDKGVDPATCKPPLKGKFKFKLNFSDVHTIYKINKQLKALCVPYRLYYTELGDNDHLKYDQNGLSVVPKIFKHAKYVETCPQNDTEKFFDGLLYPRTKQIQIDLLAQLDTKMKYISSFYPSIIDHCSLGVLPINKAYFADNDYQFDFTDGMLTRYKAVDPSGVTSFLNMFPAGRSLLSIPAELIKLRVDYQSDKEGYYDAVNLARAARERLEQGIPVPNDDEDE